MIDLTNQTKPRETRAARRRAMKEAAKQPKGPTTQVEDVTGQHPSRQQWAEAATERDRAKYGLQGANPAATRDRIKSAGLDTRIRAHVAAQGRRSQARRDSRVKK